jgi:hypothetical protein
VTTTLSCDYVHTVRVWTTVRGLPMGFNMPISTEYWDDDGSCEWASMLARLEAGGAVMVKKGEVKAQPKL